MFEGFFTAAGTLILVVGILVLAILQHGSWEECSPEGEAADISGFWSG